LTVKQATCAPSSTAQAVLNRLDGRLFATLAEGAEILSYHPRTLRRGIEAGDIPGVKAGVTYRIPLAWIRAQAQADAR
jgi:excisionase family DNA binding protein